MSMRDQTSPVKVSVAVEPAPIARRGPGRNRSHLALVGNVVFAVVFGLCAIVWFVALRPISLGGEADYVVVRGTSMLPTYRAGDLIVARQKSSYAIGDIIVYEIPAGEAGAGLAVIHRIVGGSPSAGFVTRGDNNPAPDDWRPTLPDIQGVPWLRIRRGGNVLLSLRAPATLASLAAAFALGMFLYPPTNRARRSRRSFVRLSSNA
jgi:signal peptidase I